MNNDIDYVVRWSLIVIFVHCTITWGGDYIPDIFYNVWILNSYLKIFLYLSFQIILKTFEQLSTRSFTLYAAYIQYQWNLDTVGTILPLFKITINAPNKYIATFMTTGYLILDTRVFALFNQLSKIYSNLLTR